MSRRCRTHRPRLDRPWTTSSRSRQDSLQMCRCTSRCCRTLQLNRDTRCRLVSARRPGRRPTRRSTSPVDRRTRWPPDRQWRRWRGSLQDSQAWIRCRSPPCRRGPPQPGKPWCQTCKSCWGRSLMFRCTSRRRRTRRSRPGKQWTTTERYRQGRQPRSRRRSRSRRRLRPIRGTRCPGPAGCRCRPWRRPP